MTNTLYLIIVFGDVEPSIEGPFETEGDRDAFAGEHRAETDEDGVYRLDVSAEGKPEVYSYSGGEMERLTANYPHEEA
jgi:hypothetical protein